MSDTLRIRLAGCACLIGALLRAVGAFAPGHLGDTSLMALYTATDTALVLGLTAFYVRYRSGLGWIGFGAYLLAVTAILFIRTNANSPEAYFFGAAGLSLALAALGMASLIGRTAPRGPATLWLVSFAVGAGGLAVPGATWPFLVASLIFCAAFALAGVAMIRRPHD